MQGDSTHSQMVSLVYTQSLFGLFHTSVESYGSALSDPSGFVSSRVASLSLK